METNLFKRVSESVEVTVVVTVQENITRKDIIIETIIVGEYQVVGYCEREEELVGCWCIIKVKNVRGWK